MEREHDEVRPARPAAFLLQVPPEDPPIQAPPGTYPGVNGRIPVSHVRTPTTGELLDQVHLALIYGDHTTVATVVIEPA